MEVGLKRLIDEELAAYVGESRDSTPPQRRPPATSHSPT
jgi:hypothetical protein